MFLVRDVTLIVIGRLHIRSEWIDLELGAGLIAELEEFLPDRLAAELSRPLLIFHGVQDDTIPYTGSVLFVERAARPVIELRLLKNGDHRLTAFKDEIAEAASDFFARHGAGN